MIVQISEGQRFSLSHFLLQVSVGENSVSLHSGLPSVSWFSISPIIMWITVLLILASSHFTFLLLSDLFSNGNDDCHTLHVRSQNIPINSRRSLRIRAGNP